MTPHPTNNLTWGFASAAVAAGAYWLIENAMDYAELTGEQKELFLDTRVKRERVR